MRSIKYNGKFVFAVLLIILLSSCTSTRRAGSLSSAFRKSSNNYIGERRIKARVHYFDNEDEEDEEDNDDDIYNDNDSRYSQTKWDTTFVLCDSINQNSNRFDPNTDLWFFQKLMSENYNMMLKYHKLSEESNQDQNFDMNEPERVYNDSSSISITTNQKKDWGEWVAFKFGSGFLSNSSFSGLSAFSIQKISFFSERQASSFEGGFNYSPQHNVESEELSSDENEIQAGLNGGVFMLHFGMSGRFYTTPQKTFIGNYISIGLNLQLMFWEYANTLYIEEYNENDEYVGTKSVKHDSLLGFDFHCSTGINLMQFDSFQTGLEINPGVIVWWPETFQGFNNDVFEAFMYVKFNLLLNFGHKKL
ncbi:MAG: hypothetical protein JXR48_01860 [Candidatus Delongbacteria bacterium]|nr:hypothetical protein [Candidatus Delongbacteria bacterium]MBN2833690.1 hypothetical protein [Candidatus Delongbacteria bacterium]